MIIAVLTTRLAHCLADHPVLFGHPSPVAAFISVSSKERDDKILGDFIDILRHLHLPDLGGDPAAHEVYPALQLPAVLPDRKRTAVLLRHHARLGEVVAAPGLAVLAADQQVVHLAGHEAVAKGIADDAANLGDGIHPLLLGDRRVAG
ncbi:hypothetical protein [Stenotrophomonas maltophilia]|uniref:hypothetical protein n=1 Tax=Stenotrophomonas maltophilia TaxID=40324 RepID=UPI0015DFF3CE|nr:hypothetical protein [Stenotrophomonas maltophilia]